MFCLNRIFITMRLGPSGFLGKHYRFVHMQLSKSRNFSTQIYPDLLTFTGKRTVWTTPHFLTQLSTCSTRGPPDIHPNLWVHDNQTTHHNESRLPKPSSPVVLESTVSSGVLPDKEPEKEVDKGDQNPSVWQRSKRFLLHYYHGFRLFLLECKIALAIGVRVLCGHSLTRQERKQLVRTSADIVRILPFLVFIIVPFMEFLLPIYLKFCPFMLPSTFKVKGSETEKIQQRLKAKLELTKFLQETLNHTSFKGDGSPTVSEFQTFLKKVQESGIPPANEEITRFSKLFEDQVTLESLQKKQLKMLCQLLSLHPVGPNNLLRFQIWMRVRQLKAEDRLLVKEGVAQIPSWELQSLCQDRGMRSVGLTEERLRSQLSEWLALHLEQNVPVTLLLFSRALHISKASASELSLKEAIAQLPSAASEEATAHALEASTSSRVDPKTKIEVLRKVQANIKAARVQRKQELDEQKSTSLAETKHANEVLKDTAPQLVGLLKEDLESPPTEAPSSHAHKLSIPAASVAPKDVSSTQLPESCPSCVPEAKVASVGDKAHEDATEISIEDLTQIRSAIATSSNALQEEAFEELKEDVADTAKMREQHKAALVSSKRMSKGESRLAAKVNKLIGEMDHLIEKLSDERQQLLNDIELREMHVKQSSEPTEKFEIIDAIKADHQRVVDINDLLRSLRQIQKVPDDTRWQKILDVLDEDQDGKIELQHVLSVIELLGTENVKVSSKEVKRMLETLDNEELIEDNDSSATAGGSAPEPNNDLTAADIPHLSDSSKPTGDATSTKSTPPK